MVDDRWSSLMHLVVSFGHFKRQLSKTRLNCDGPWANLAFVYYWQELPQVSFLSRQKRLLWRQNYVCCDKSFVTTNIILSRQAYFFSRQKTCFVKSFVATKMILVAAPANDICEGLVMLLKVLREEPSRCIKTSPMLPKVLREETSRYSRTSPMLPKLLREEPLRYIKIALMLPKLLHDMKRLCVILRPR